MGHPEFLLSLRRFAEMAASKGAKRIIVQQNLFDLHKRNLEWKKFVVDASMFVVYVSYVLPNLETGMDGPPTLCHSSARVSLSA
jgi:hypothetical protein